MFSGVGKWFAVKRFSTIEESVCVVHGNYGTRPFSGEFVNAPGNERGIPFSAVL